MTSATSSHTKEIVMTQNHWTLQQVAELLQVNVRTVQRWIREGRMVATRIGPTLMRVSSDDLERFLRGGHR